MDEQVTGAGFRAEPVCRCEGSESRPICSDKANDAPPSGPKARDIPGSLPAVILMLVMVAVDWVVQGDSHRNSVAIFWMLIVSMGLLKGGPGFRVGGSVICAIGLVALFLERVGGGMGPSGMTMWLDSAACLGLLLLLVGVPSRRRVWTGVGICVATLLVSCAILLGGAILSLAAHR
jgi:hypothetical protein